MKDLRVQIHMHFESDAMLTAVFIDNNGVAHVITRSVIKTGSYENYFNQRKEMNQIPTVYSFRIEEIPDEYELDLDASKVEYGFLNLRYPDRWNIGSPFRKDTLASLSSQA